MKNNEIILFFDGVCELCFWFIEFVSKRDKKKVFLFTPLQGETAKEHLDLKDIQSLSSIVVLKENKLYREGQALKVIFKSLYPYSLFLLLWLMPPFLLNKVYHFIAKKRYRWFGRKENKNFSPRLQKTFLP